MPLPFARDLTSALRTSASLTTRCRPAAIPVGVKDGWFVRLVADRRISTYGIGVPLLTLLRDPIHGSRTIDMGAVR